ncbi:AbrB/MazE/SpoVT family DNA-binding domain-containing protein [Microbacterium sp. GXF0217]
MSATATMTSKGQITIPKEIRESLGLTTGSRVMFVTLPKGQAAMVPRTGTIEALFGMLHYPGIPTMSIDEINEAIAEGGAASGLRGLHPEDDA